MGMREEALQEIKGRRKELIKKFADLSIYLPVENPFTIFMAGSPGAGKTEFSNKFDPSIYKYKSDAPIVKIDADAIRKLLPQFTGNNSDEVQPAATNGMEKLFDHIQDHNQNAIVDTTFSDFNKASKNVKRSLDHHRKVGIFYIHLDPKIAWAYTQLRQTKEGRSVTKEFFIESYFRAKDNVNKIKEIFPEIEVNLIEKEETGNENNPIKIKTSFNIEKVDYYLKLVYNRNELEKIVSSQ